MDQTTPLPLEAKQKKPVNPAKRKKLALFGGSLLIVLVVPFVLRATLKTPVKDARHQEIAQMTERERTRLEHNYAEFQKLSEAEKARYRQLHQALEADDTEGGDLKRILKQYEDWLRELPLWQRDEINRQTDPAAKARLVAHYAEEERERDAQEKELLSNVLDFSPPGSNGQPNSRFVRLSPEDLSAVMAVLEDHLPLAQRPGRDIKGLARYDSLLKASLIASVPSGTRPDEFFRAWPNDALTEKIIDAIDDPRIQRRFGELNSTRDKQRTVRFLVASGLSAELMREFYRRMPKEEELQEFIETLDKEKLDQFTAMSPGKAKGELIKWYLMAKREKPPKEVEQIRSTIYKLYMRKPGRFGGPRPGGNRDPRRPGDRDDRGGRGDRDRGERGDRDRDRNGPPNGNRPPFPPRGDGE